MAVYSFLNKTCAVRRPSQAAGSVMGETVTTLSTALTGVPCAVQMKDSSKQGGPAAGGTEEYEAYFLYGANVQAGDLLSSVTGFTNYRFSVDSDPLDDSGRQTYARFLITHRQGGGIR